MAKHLKDYLLKPGKSAHLDERDTEIKKLYDDDHDAEAKLEKSRAELATIQETLYADQRFGVLVLFQGMDASGKDGAIKHVMTGLNPQGVSVTSFSSPSEEERRHDFIWRTHQHMPTRGHIGIFNRSYYEEVVTVRVNPDFLRKEGIEADGDWDSSFWQGRFESIVDYEKMLTREGYRIVKIFLHLSRKEQRKRLLARIDEAEKNWKFDPNDMVVRGQWEKYQQAYDDALTATSSDHAPWYIVPADDKPNARLIISKILVENLGALPLRYPEVSKERRKLLKQIGRELRG